MVATLVFLLQVYYFFFQAEDGIRDKLVTGVQTCALPILSLNDFEKKSIHVTKAQKIIFGLRRTLDFEKGGEIAMNLDSLYDYCIRTLTSAHCTNDRKKFAEAQGILEDLLSGWKEIKK